MKKLGFGCMRLPVKNGEQDKIDINQFKEMIDVFMDRGFTYFDTAFVYHKGMSEEALKEALVKRYPRDSYTITTKLYLHELQSMKDMEDMFNTQLERLGVDYVDYYWMHAVRLNLFDRVKEFGVVDFMKNLKATGKVKHLGFSYHDTAENLEKILSENCDWVEYVQLQLNYLDWESESVQSRKCYEVCVKYNKPVIVMEPVKGGNLVNLPEKAFKKFKDELPNMSTASWAIRYAASLDNVMVVLSGMSNMEQLKDNTSYMVDFKPLNDKEKNIILEVIEILKTEKVIACTGCRYCVDGCPKQIPIPDIFSVFNDVHRKMFDYKATIEGKGKASECIKCGACESVCPQKLPIREYLSTCSKLFENK